MKKEKRRQHRIMAVLIICFVILFAVSLVIGRYSISFSELVGMIGSFFDTASVDNASAVVFFQSRLPRVIVAALIGVALAVSGAAYQGVFRNPMVSPDILGASQGAGFGAALGILLGMGGLATQFLAFGTGIVSVALTLGLSKIIGDEHGNSRLILVLCGIVTGALFQAFISIVKYVADPFDTMPSIAFWLMGGLTYVKSTDILFVLIPVGVGAVILLLIRWKINLLAFGDEEAAAMGVPVKKYRMIIIICSTLMTSAAVAIGGMIGWVGLIVPHFARIITGPDYRKMLPCAVVIGAIFLLGVDDIVRSVSAQELPIGILTAIVGAPVFAALLVKAKRSLV